MSRRWTRSVLCWTALSPVLALTLFPFAIMLSTALKPTAEVLIYPPRWLPIHWSLHSFVAMWRAVHFGVGLENSLTIGALATLLVIAVSVPAGYALCRFPFAGRGGYRQFLLTTQMLSPALLVLGLFRLAASIHIGAGTLVDTRLAVIVTYGGFNLAFAVWMLASYFAAVPAELEEAAWIDGCGRLRAIIHIFLPLALPAIAVTAIVTFVACWNEFIVALTLLRSPSNQTVTLQVVNLVAGRYTVEWNQVMAATLAATAPVAVLFIWLQRYLVRGLALGGVK
jgi:multiple sugar transport system permease protein